MVKHKKIKAESEGNSKPILASDPLAERIVAGFGPTGENEGDSALPSELPVADILTKPFMQTDQDLLREAQTTITDLTRLINECPKSEFYKIEDALGYQDKWDKWHSKVLTQWQKQ